MHNLRQDIPEYSTNAPYGFMSITSAFLHNAKRFRILSIIKIKGWRPINVRLNVHIPYQGL